MRKKKLIQSQLIFHVLKGKQMNVSFSQIISYQVNEKNLQARLLPYILSAFKDLWAEQKKSARNGLS